MMAPGKRFLLRHKLALRPSEAVEPQSDDFTIRNISSREPVGKRLGELRAIYLKGAEVKTGY